MANDDIGRIRDKMNGQAKVEALDGTFYETDNAENYEDDQLVRFEKLGGGKVKIIGPAK